MNAGFLPSQCSRATDGARTVPRCPSNLALIVPLPPENHDGRRATAAHDDPCTASMNAQLWRRPPRTGPSALPSRVPSTATTLGSHRVAWDAAARGAQLTGGRASGVPRVRARSRSHGGGGPAEKDGRAHAGRLCAANICFPVSPRPLGPGRRTVGAISPGRPQPCPRDRPPDLPRGKLRSHLYEQRS